MAHDTSRFCVECQGPMSPIIVMDKRRGVPTEHRDASTLEYRMPDDKLSFWTGKYPTAGPVQATMCAECGRIALYGGTAEA